MRGRTFDVHVACSVDVDDLEWPTAKDLESETLGGNRDYIELDNVTWAEVEDAIALERELIDEFDSAPDCDVAHEKWLEGQYDDSDGFLLGLDVGTNALTMALKAAGCLPFYSCNGGAFGGYHNDSCPIVAFYCRAQIFPHVLTAATQAGAGLEHNHAGGITVYAANVDCLIDVASRLYSLQSIIPMVRPPA